VDIATLDQKQLDDMEGITISTSTTPTQNPALSNLENEISSLQSQVQTCDAGMDAIRVLRWGVQR
jgi:hypothetical protein